MAHKQWRFRLVVPLDNPRGRPQYGSLNVFVGSVEILFERFCSNGSPEHGASTQALAMLKKHCTANKIPFQMKKSSCTAVTTGDCPVDRRK
jgi:hypothetical protein